MFKLLVPTMALALAPLPALAEQPLLHFVGVTSSADVIQDDFDVAGVMLGMQPSDAFAALEERGYKIDEEEDWTERGPSFHELVEIKSGEMSEGAAEDSWEQVVFRKGTEEAVHIRFIPLPTGTAATEVAYYNMAPTMNNERFLEAIKSKYGKPRAIDGNELRYSDIKMSGNSWDREAGAIRLQAGGRMNGFRSFQDIKGWITMKGGKVSLLDPDELAKNWTPEPAKTTF